MGAFYHVARLGEGEEMMFKSPICCSLMILLCFVRLMWFESISGLKINLDKSEILPIRRIENVEEFALELSNKVGALPYSYLGLYINLWWLWMAWRRGSRRSLHVEEAIYF